MFCPTSYIDRLLYKKYQMDWVPSQLPENHGFVSVQQHAALGVPHHRAGQH